MRLFAQGAPADVLYLIGAGAVKLIRSTRAGRDVIVALRMPGWLLGLAPALVGEPHPAAGVTVGHCELIPLAKAEFDACRGRDDGFRRGCETLLAREMVEQVRRAGRVVLPVRARLHRVLADLAAACGQVVGAGSTRIPLRLTQDELAALAGSTRVTVARALADLARDGLVRRERGCLFLTRSTAASGGRSVCSGEYTRM